MKEKYRGVIQEKNRTKVFQIENIFIEEKGVYIEGEGGSEVFLLKDTTIQKYIPFQSASNKQLAEGDVVINKKYSFEESIASYKIIKKDRQGFILTNLFGDKLNEKIKDGIYYVVGNVSDENLLSLLRSSQTRNNVLHNLSLK